MPVQYNSYLVLISAFIAMLASYVALELAGQVTVSRGFDRKFWLTLGAFAMGIGIWSMHFVAMLAFSIPISIDYDFLLVLVSMLAAVVASGQALLIVSRPTLTTPILLIGSTCMGIAIAGMHYIGMAAMQMRADIQYNPFIFGLSVVIAIVVSLVALKIAFAFRNRTGAEARWGKIASAVVMGFAVLSMHYTGMAAANFVQNNNKVVESSLGTDNYFLGFLVAIVTLAILGSTLFILYINNESTKKLTRKRRS